jgi:hypothetical protein
MKKHILVIVLLNLALAIVGIVNSQQKNNAGYYPTETECISSELDGSITVKSWGSGRNRFDAIDQAQKNAIFDVLFKGILKGAQQCNVKPLISEVNAFDKYARYFNKFFSDKQKKYKEFISFRDERIEDSIDRETKGAKNGVSCRVIITIKRNALYEQLIKDKIIKKQN